MYYVYTYSDPKTNVPFYVGKGSNQRRYVHLNETVDTTTNYLKWCKIQSLRKDGLEPLIEIVFESNDEVDCYDEEKRLIQLYKRFVDGGTLTNMCLDGRPPNPKGKTRSAENRENISRAKRGGNNPMWGKIPWNKGMFHTVETRAKISNANKGRKYSIEEHRLRQESRGHAYCVTGPDGVTVEVHNLKDWAKRHNLSYQNLREALTGYRGKTQYRGYTGYKIKGS